MIFGRRQAPEISCEQGVDEHAMQYSRSYYLKFHML